jgi:hypothetical protein
MSAAERPSAVRKSKTYSLSSLSSSSYDQVFARRQTLPTHMQRDRVRSLTADGFDHENDPTRANPKLPLVEEASPYQGALFLFCVYTFSSPFSYLLSSVSLFHICIYLSWASKCPRSSRSRPGLFERFLVAVNLASLRARRVTLSSCLSTPLLPNRISLTRVGKFQKKQLAVHFGVSPRPEI